MSCTCVKDHTITCLVHPHEYQQIEVMGKHIAKLQAEVKLQSDSADHWEDEAMNHMSQAAKLQADYNELLYQVQNTHPNETRHETAKRIIHQHENRQSNGPEQAIKEVEK